MMQRDQLTIYYDILKVIMYYPGIFETRLLSKSRLNTPLLNKNLKVLLKFNMIEKFIILDKYNITHKKYYNTQKGFLYLRDYDILVGYLR